MAQSVPVLLLLVGGHRQRSDLLTRVLGKLSSVLCTGLPISIKGTSESNHFIY